MDAGLKVFIANECANYDRHYKLCGDPQKNHLDAPPCEVLEGRPCPYFERAVLGPPDYPYKAAGYDWPALFAQYGRINRKFSCRGVTVRECPDCGDVLQPRQRYCPKCSRQRRFRSYRSARKSKGSTRNS